LRRRQRNLGRFAALSVARALLCRRRRCHINSGGGCCCCLGGLLLARLLGRGSGLFAMLCFLVVIEEAAGSGGGRRRDLLVCRGNASCRGRSLIGARTDLLASLDHWHLLAQERIVGSDAGIRVGVASSGAIG